MTGKKTVKNLVAYLAPLFDVPVYTFDQNAKRELPCIVVGYDSDEQTKAGLFGHFTVNGFVMAAVNGREDQDNAEADELAEDIAAALCDQEALEAAINAANLDRPAENFHCNRLFVRGTEREEQESSTFVFVRWEAFTRNAD